MEENKKVVIITGRGNTFDLKKLIDLAKEKPEDIDVEGFPSREPINLSLAKKVFSEYKEKLGRRE